MLIYNILLIVQIIVALSIIGLVLIQHGKGADAGAAFGGGASGSVFGSRGSGNFLSRSTGILAAVFFANSLALAWLVAHRGDSSLSADQSVVPAEQTREVRPAPVVEPTAPSDVPTNVGSPEKAEAQAVAPAKKGEAPADVPQ
jgi:preprotein translocase subunit SecG